MFFTRTNKREEDHFAVHELDRVMANENWLEEFKRTEMLSFIIGSFGVQKT